MRTITIIATSFIAAAAITLTACENFFGDIYDRYTADTIYMFASSLTYDGNLGGREGADDICQANYDASHSHLGVKNVRALISVSPDDQMRDMPANFGVPEAATIVGPSGSITIASNWDDLMDKSISNSMQMAGVGSGIFYWTGDSGDALGYIHATDTCSGWTKNDGSLRGYYGDGTAINNFWLANGVDFCSVASVYRVLCIAW